MITCPWCGTNYVTFQPNCKNCGGQIPYSEQTPAQARPSMSASAAPALMMPPPAPRAISNSYLRKLMLVDAWGIVGFVFALLGSIFTFVGFILTIAIVTAFVGIPFALFGILFLAGGVAALRHSYQKASKTIQVLREGQAAPGQIMNVEQNYNVRINGQNPWVIYYQFEANGRTYEGRISTLNPPRGELQPGNPVYVLYLPNTPEHNALYPHP